MIIPIKKSKKQIQIYKAYGPLFGSILKKTKSFLEEKKDLKISQIYEILKSFTSEELKGEKYSFPFLKEKNYKDSFNRIACISINEIIGHGLPDINLKLENKDVVSVDFGLKIFDLFFDGAFTFYFGKQKEKPEWIDKPLNAIKNINGKRIEDTSGVSEIIQKTAIEKPSLDIIASVTGHGIGINLHESPLIHNAIGSYSKVKFFDGLVFCVEPIYSFNNGEETAISQTYIDSDNWSIVTTNKKKTSHFETMFIYEENVLIDLLEMSKW